MKLSVRSHHILGANERVVRLQVFCPGQRRSVDYEECASCPRLSSVPVSPEAPGACIDCSPVGATSADSPTIPTRDEPIGSLAGTRVLCIHANLPIERLADAFREWSGVELPVVDGRGYLLGSIWRDDFICARRPARVSGSFVPTRWANDCVDHANTLHESSSIASAVEALATRRARTLILVRGDSGVVGVLTDLALLRWFAREQRVRAGVSAPLTSVP